MVGDIRVKRGWLTPRSAEWRRDAGIVGLVVVVELNEFEDREELVRGMMFCLAESSHPLREVGTEVVRVGSGR